MHRTIDDFQLNQQIIATGRILTARAVRRTAQALEVARTTVVFKDNVTVKVLKGHAMQVYQRSTDRRVSSGKMTGPARLSNWAFALVLFSLLLLSGCAGVVTRPMPDPAAPTRPVFLLDHGRHASLVLTRADYSLVRYAHGDWTWYAEDRSGPVRAVSALFVPSRSAIGRRELAPIMDEDGLRRQIRVEIRTIHHLTAAAEKIDALDMRLTALFEAGAQERLFNHRFDLEFVPGPRPYTLFDNSNHVVAEWLEALGIRVRGNPVFGHWRLEEN